MKNLKKIGAFALSLILLGCALPVSANASNSEEGLVSIEVISNEEADAFLPEYMVEAFAEETEDVSGNVSTYGLSYPSKKDKWNLDTEGKYEFSVDTQGSAIYSDYVFTGHGGSVKVHLNETTSSSGKYTFKLCKRGLINTTIYKYEFSHGLKQTISMNDFDSDDLIYFIIDPNKYTYMASDSYIKKN